MANIKLSLVLCCVAGFAQAGGWEQSIDLSASAEYDSNPAMLENAGESVWRGRLAPKYSLNGTFGRDEFGLAIGLLAEHSSDERLSSNREDKSGSLLWGRIIDTGNVQFVARTDEASSRSVEFEESGLVSRDSTRRTNSANMTGSKSLSENTSLAMGASHTEAKYEDATLSDYKVQGSSLSLIHALSELTSTNVRFATSRFEPDEPGIPSESYSLSLGLSAQSGEHFNWSAQYGLRHSAAESETKGSDGSLSLQWTGDVDDFSIVLSRQYSPSSVGTMSVIDAFKGAWQRKWGNKSRSSAGISVANRRGTLETKTAQATVALVYTTSVSSNVRLYMQHKRLDQNNSIATASIIGAALAYNWLP